MAGRPRIGITMRLEVETRRFYLGRDYSEAVAAAGGSPIHIPLIADPELIGHVVGHLDGILLPGSDTDPDPAYYGEEPHPKLKKVVPEKDSTDLMVIAEADRRRLPVLGICYGMQILNVSRGGNLIQDIETGVDAALKHEQGLPLERESHFINVLEGSLLASLIDPGTKEMRVRVNSHHHQAVREPGRGLKAVARSDDGVIEAVEDGDADRFVLGVQWHPELSWRGGGLSSQIFKRFVSSCSAIGSKK